MAKLEKSHYWKAVAEIQATNIAFSTYISVHRKGMRVDSVELVSSQSWLKDTDIMFDVGKRMKGWIKEQVKTMKPSLGDKLRFSLAANSISLENKVIFGQVKIGDIKELSGLSKAPTEEEFKKPDMFTTYPFKNVFVGENKRYVNSYYYILPKDVKLKAELFCWTKDFTPKDCKAMLETFGSGIGIGDLHTQGYGKFQLLNFEVISEGDIL